MALKFWRKPKRAERVRVFYSASLAKARPRGHVDQSPQCLLKILLLTRRGRLHRKTAGTIRFWRDAAEHHVHARGDRVWSAAPSHVNRLASGQSSSPIEIDDKRPGESTTEGTETTGLPR